MHKKIISILFTIILATTLFNSLVTAQQPTTDTIQQQRISKNPLLSQFNTTPHPENTTQIISEGPVTPWLSIASFVIISGPLFKTFLIRFILFSMKAYFLLPEISLPITDLTFAIRYNYNLAAIPSLSNFAFNTTITQNNVTTSYTTRHVVLVTGFNGVFEFSRFDIPNLEPAHFKFEGTCDGVLITT